MMREVFESIAAPIAGEPHPLARTLASGPMRGAFLRSWRLMAIDGFEVDVPDTPGNVEEFGYSGSGETRSVFPKIRVVALAECGTHAMVAAEVEGINVSENKMAARLFGRLRPQDILTADRNFYSFDDWCYAARTGAQLLWRAPTQLRLPVLDVLEDGTYLSVVVESSLRGTRREQIVQVARETTSEFGATTAPGAGAGRDLHEAFADNLAERGIDPETGRLKGGRVRRARS